MAAHDAVDVGVRGHARLHVGLLRVSAARKTIGLRNDHVLAAGHLHSFRGSKRNESSSPGPCASWPKDGRCSLDPSPALRTGARSPEGDEDSERGPEGKSRQKACGYYIEQLFSCQGAVRNGPNGPHRPGGHLPHFPAMFVSATTLRCAESTGQASAKDVGKMGEARRLRIARRCGVPGRQ